MSGVGSRWITDPDHRLAAGDYDIDVVLARPAAAAASSPPVVRSSLPCAVSLRVIRVFRPDGSHVNYHWNSGVCNIRGHIGVKGAWGVQQRGGTKRYMLGWTVPPAGEYDIVIGETAAHRDRTAACWTSSASSPDAFPILHLCCCCAVFVLLSLLAATAELSLDWLWLHVS